MMLKEAILYKKLDEKKVSCFLCAYRCKISDGDFGVCKVRQNKGGTLYTYTYGEIAAAHVDPIEKKPIFHMLPGSKSFSIAAIGCNFHCSFCQNWQISQKSEADKLDVRIEKMSAQEVIQSAKKYGCESISYTYTEPTIFMEFACDAAKLAKENGLSNIFVTNGYMTEEALEVIRPYLDAANVDLKFFNDEIYRKVCGGRLLPVLESIRLMRKLKIWVEVTTLIVPGQNDSCDELQKIAKFLCETGEEIPWHISRFHPDYKMDAIEATPVSKLKEAYKIGKDAGLRYVYIGNVLEEEKTLCYNCQRDLIVRLGFDVLSNVVKNSKCPYCGSAIDGIELS